MASGRNKYLTYIGSMSRASCEIAAGGDRPIDRFLIDDISLYPDFIEWTFGGNMRMRPTDGLNGSLNDHLFASARYSALEAKCSMMACGNGYLQPLARPFGVEQCSWDMESWKPESAGTATALERYAAAL